MESLLFTAAGGRFLSRLNQLNEVLMPARLDPLPGGPGFLAGLLNLRGGILPVITLAERLGQSQCGPLKRTARILHTDCSGHPIGVLVDSVAGIQVLVQTQRRDPLGGEDSAPFMGDLWLIDGHLIQEIHLPALLRGNELSQLTKAPPRLAT